MSSVITVSTCSLAHSTTSFSIQTPNQEVGNSFNVYTFAHGPEKENNSHSSHECWIRHSLNFHNFWALSPREKEWTETACWLYESALIKSSCFFTSDFCWGPYCETACKSHLYGQCGKATVSLAVCCNKQILVHHQSRRDKNTTVPLKPHPPLLVRIRTLPFHISLEILQFFFAEPKRTTNVEIDNSIWKPEQKSLWNERENDKNLVVSSLNHFFLSVLPNGENVWMKNSFLTLIFHFDISDSKNRQKKQIEEENESCRIL